MKAFEQEEFLYSLIIEDLDQSIAPEHKLLLDQWREESEANEKMYQDFKDIQLKLEKLYTLNKGDAQKSWQVLEEKIEQQPERERLADKKDANYSLWYKIAAAILVVLSVWIYTAQDKYVTVENTAGSAIRHLTLPDGTVLSLNASTRLKYEKDFNDNRTLQLLEGEVFIHHVANRASRFSVQIEDVQAVDIGTSFNVSKTAQDVTVIVEEGKVALRRQTSDEGVLINPGKIGTYDLKTKQLSAGSNDNPNYKSWIDKKFVFDEVSIAEVADQLEKTYKVPVTIRPRALGRRKLTASLHYQTVDSALAVISASLQCKVTKEKDGYVLSDQ